MYTISQTSLLYLKIYNNTINKVDYIIYLYTILYNNIIWNFKVLFKNVTTVNKEFILHPEKNLLHWLVGWLQYFHLSVNRINYLKKTIKQWGNKTIDSHNIAIISIIII